MIVLQGIALYQWREEYYIVVVVRTKYSKSYTSFTKLVYLKVAVVVLHTINIDGETNPFENDFFRKIEYFAISALNTYQSVL